MIYQWLMNGVNYIGFSHKQIWYLFEFYGTWVLTTAVQLHINKSFLESGKIQINARRNMKIKMSIARQIALFILK